MRNPEILKQLKEQFTLLTVDYYDNGEDVDTFVFKADEITEFDAENLWITYDNLYGNGDYDGAFEDYLAERGVNYYVIQ